MPISFHNLENEKIRRCFTKVWKRYDSLHSHKIDVVQKRIKGSTMQAQPVIHLSSLFSKQKHYRIKVAMYVRDSNQIKVADLPEDVLTGWFAHELGHVVDYEPYSNWRMITFGLKYIFSSNFKRKVEHEADYIAIKNGFKSEILASKRYILESGLISQKYIAKIAKFYLPIADVELCTDEEVILPDAEL